MSWQKSNKLEYKIYHDYEWLQISSLYCQAFTQGLNKM